jgi:hypothetical protein
LLLSPSCSRLRRPRNTVSGVGEDVSAAGKAIDDAAEDAKN